MILKVIWMIISRFLSVDIFDNFTLKGLNVNSPG